jgi:iron(III) transport system substrate-binding protein
MKKLSIRRLALAASILGACAPAVQAQDKVIHVYSARHYPGDVQLYSAFTQATGIQIKRVDADDAGILQRLTR